MSASFIPHWDYAKFRIPMDELPSFLDYLAMVWNCEWEFREVKYYDCAVTLPGGVLACWGRGSTDYALIEMKGSAINSLVPEQQVHLLKTIGEHGGSFTWIDVNIDDHRPEAPQPHDIERWVSQDKTIRLARFQKLGFIKSDTGSTFHAGDYNTKYLRIYNKHLNEKGEHIPRYEMKFKDPLYAEQAGQLLLSSAMKDGQDGIAETCCALVLGSVSFLEVGEGTHRERDKVAPFWEKFVEELKVSPVKLVYAKVKADIWKTISWLEKSVAKSLVMADKFWKGMNKGGDFISHLRSIGNAAIKPEDELKISNMVSFQKKGDPIIRSESGSALLHPRYLLQGWHDEVLARESETVASDFEEARLRAKYGTLADREAYQAKLNPRKPLIQAWPFDVQGSLLETADYDTELRF